MDVKRFLIETEIEFDVTQNHKGREYGSRFMEETIIKMKLKDYKKIQCCLSLCSDYDNGSVIINKNIVTVCYWTYLNYSVIGKIKKYFRIKDNDKILKMFLEGRKKNLMDNVNW